MTGGEEVAGVISGEDLSGAVSGGEVGGAQGGAAVSGESGGEALTYPPPPTTLSVATYNVQNLFDFIDDPERDEGEFTPQRDSWTRGTYTAKVNAIAEALIFVDADVVTLQEVESETVLSDVADAVRRLGGRDYAHWATSSTRDIRGISLGVLSVYPVSREIGRPINAQVQCASGEQLDGSRPEARPIYEVNLWSDGTGEGRGGGPDSLTLLINHWKSRAAGDARCRVSEHQERGARQLRELLEDWMSVEPQRAVIVLGDFNATDAEPAMSDVMNAHLNVGDINSASALYNLWGELGVEDGDPANVTTGSYRYDGLWFRLDHILVNRALLSSGEGRWELVSFEQIRNATLLRDGSPYYWSSRRREGYSDHLPLKVNLRLR